MDSHWMKVRGWGTARRRKREEDVLNYFKKNLVTWAALPHRLCEYYSITVHCFCYAEFHTSGYDCFFRPNKKKELPIHYGIKCFHSIQVRVAVVTSNCKNSAHQRCDANSPPWGCKLCDILPFVTTWVKALHGTQRRVVIEATCKESPYTEMWPLPVVVIAQMCIAGLFLACSGLEPQSTFLTKSQSRMKIKQQLSPLSTSSCSTFKTSPCWKPKEETNPWIRLTSVMRSHCLWASATSYFLATTPLFKCALVVLSSPAQEHIVQDSSVQRSAPGLLTNNIQATVELTDAVAGSSLAHLFHFHPLVQMGIVFLHAGKRRYAVIATHSVDVVLKKLHRERLFRRLRWYLKSRPGSWPWPARKQTHHEGYGADSPPGRVHGGYCTPSIGLDVVSFHITEARVVI